MGDATPTTAPTNRNRRRLRFRLRTLLLMLAALSVWLATVSRRAIQQQRAVAIISAAGGEVRYDFEFDKNFDRRPDDPAPPGPEWLRAVLGVDYFASVTCVEFRNADDQSLSAVAELPELRALVLTGDLKITDVGLQYLENLQQLQELRIDGCKNVTDAGLKHLCGLKHLWGLATHGTQTTAAGVRELSRTVPNLEVDYFECRNPLSPFAPGVGRVVFPRPSLESPPTITRQLEPFENAPY